MVDDLESLLNDFPIPPLSSTESVKVIDSSWSGNTLTLSDSASVAVYALNGALLHRAPGVSCYSLESFTPGNYIVAVYMPDGTTKTFNRLR